MLLRLICYIAYCFLSKDLNPLSASLTKWSNTLKQFVGNLPTNLLSVFDRFVGLALKGLKSIRKIKTKKLQKQSPRVYCRSSHPELFCKKGVIRNFAKFTGKHLCQSLFFNKVSGLRPANLSKRGSGKDVFAWILRNF